MALTSEQRAAAKEAKRRANREAWHNSPNNANAHWKLRYEQENRPLPEVVLDPGEDRGSASLAKLRAIMAEPDGPIFRRLDAADIIIDYELAPGAAVGVPPEQIASSAYAFYHAVEANPKSPEALRFRALKSIARIENSRAAAAQSPQAHHENREFFRRLVNAARSAELRKAGVWHQIVAMGAAWALKPSDDFEVPVLPNYGSAETDMIGDYLDTCNRRPAVLKEQQALERAANLLDVKATNREDDWERLL